ncbi:hypothetical protein FIBSPDRAFT_886380 [Athelia psychrophila]|uniref:Uncharacterized protein n=1 Tax=Athelia psychrophila TaxID=1759441 RepID=A0A166QRY3_9AGAM|nr:hypothetical protein FIBSPDRAFT_886380 [Fibularhizoctonia sp. CBS 109695]
MPLNSMMSRQLPRPRVSASSGVLLLAVAQEIKQNVPRQENGPGYVPTLERQFTEEVVSLVAVKSLLVNLPISIYGPLLERSICPQNLAAHLTLPAANGALKTEARTSTKGFETIEIGLAQGAVVEIGLLHDPPLARSVSAKPVSADGWEIIVLMVRLKRNNRRYTLDMSKTPCSVKCASRRYVEFSGKGLFTSRPTLRCTSRPNCATPPLLLPKKPQTATSKQENALGSASAPVDKTPSKILLVLPASVHNLGISVDSSARLSWVRPPNHCVPHTPAPNRSRSPRKVDGGGDYFHKARLHLLSGPLGRFAGASCKDSALAAPEAKVLTAKDPSAASAPKSDGEKAKGDQGKEGGDVLCR